MHISSLYPSPEQEKLMLLTVCHYRVHYVTISAQLLESAGILYLTPQGVCAFVCVSCIWELHPVGNDGGMTPFP